VPALLRPWRRPSLAPALLIFLFAASGCDSDDRLTSPDEDPMAATPDFQPGGKKSGAIGGTVSAAHFGPLAGVAVTVTPGGKTATTGAAGTYEIGKLAAGGYSVALSRTPSSCFRPAPLSVTVQGGATTQASFALTCRRIAYARTSPAGFQIHTVNADGTGDTPITSGAAGASDPSWSPDGNRLAFTRGGEIWAMDANGTNATQLTTGALGGRPAWSPDGGRIAYVSFANGRTDLWVMAANGTGQTNLTATATFSEDDPAWSPDGTRLLFTQGGDIWVMNATAGSGATKLTASPFADADPDWSPDGTKIVYAAASMADDGEGSADVTYEIWVMNADGSSPVRLTNDANPDWEPAWSPDGSRIVWTGLRPATPQLFTMAATGGIQVPLAAAVAEGADW
jgi:TolB protein